ncbi:MAG TPA: hypothetical protein VHZ26_20420 [Caulobacteraceae bacterium]|nr:hypothetical protein [Caulobacteraceae bacterium]
MGGKAWEARAGDLVRLKSGGAVMTAERLNPAVEHPFAHRAWLDLASSEAFTNTDCPEARMASDNHNNNNNKLR